MSMALPRQSRRARVVSGSIESKGQQSTPGARWRRRRLMCWQILQRSKNSQGLSDFLISSSSDMCGLAVPANHILRTVPEVPISDAI